MFRSLAHLLVFAVIAGSLPGCEEVAEESCQPLDEPTFVNVYNLVLEPGCAVGGSCHGGGASAGGLDLGTLNTAYESLLNTENVIPGSAGESVLMMRLDSGVNAPGHMPPGQLLDEADRCMVAAWIMEGAAP